MTPTPMEKRNWKEFFAKLSEASKEYYQEKYRNVMDVLR